MADLEGNQKTGEERTHIHFHGSCSECGSHFTTCAFVYGRGNNSGLPHYYKNENQPRSVGCPFCGNERCCEIEEFPTEQVPAFVSDLAASFAVVEVITDPADDQNPNRRLN